MGIEEVKVKRINVMGLKRKRKMKTKYKSGR